MRGLGARGVGGAADRRLGPAPLTAPSSRSSFQQRLSYTTLSDLALALLDGTVFEIVQGLLDIQHLTEKSLYTTSACGCRTSTEVRGGDGTAQLPARELGLPGQFRSLRAEAFRGYRSKEALEIDRIEGAGPLMTNGSSRFYFVSCKVIFSQDIQKLPARAPACPHSPSRQDGPRPLCLVSPLAGLVLAVGRPQ